MAKCIEIKPRYIDANEINWQQVEYEYGKRNNTIIACEIAVDETPEVDVAPVIHAYWIGGDYGDWFCSECDSVLRFYGEPKHLRYCYRCGAKMDGDETS